MSDARTAAHAAAPSASDERSFIFVLNRRAARRAGNTQESLMNPKANQRGSYTRRYACYQNIPRADRRFVAMGDDVLRC
jgi:hypothetical protein